MAIGKIRKCCLNPSEPMLKSVMQLQALDMRDLFNWWK